jgi:hypothetical protein
VEEDVIISIDYGQLQKNAWYGMMK